MKQYEIIGVGGPILDQLVRITDVFLEKKVPGKKGGMEPIDFKTLEDIIAASGNDPVSLPGGSARNTLHGLSRLGEKCALIGKIGKDPRAEIYKKLLSQQGIESLLLESDTPTAIVLALITPDGERTMRTFQGASIEIRGSDINPSVFTGVKLVHLEGYTLFNNDLAETVMHDAKEAGAKVSFDLSSFEIVHKFRDKILFLLENYVDVIFANQDESFALTKEKDESLACDFLAEKCEIGIVLMGRDGCYVKSNNHKVHCPAYPVEPLDTTGAGDLFASGFLHGYLAGYPIEICAHYGAIAGRAVVQVIGPIIPPEVWDEIYKMLKQQL